MKQSEYSVRVLEPSEGMMLTQSADVAVSNRVVSDKVFLSATAKPSDWKEITLAEAEEIEREKKSVLSDAGINDGKEVSQENETSQAGV